MGFRLNPCPLLKQEETNDHLRGFAHQSDQAIGGYPPAIAGSVHRARHCEGIVQSLAEEIPAWVSSLFSGLQSNG